MATNTGVIPKLTWGPSFANTLEFGRPIEQVKAYAEPAPGRSTSATADGGVIVWSLGHDQLIEFVAKAVPREDELTEYGITATGWSGDLGWEGMLETAFTRAVVRFFPNRSIGTYISGYIVKPWKDPPTAGWFFHRDVVVSIRALSQFTPFVGY